MKKTLVLFLLLVIASCSPYAAPPLGLDHPASPRAAEAPAPSPSQALAPERR